MKGPTLKNKVTLVKHEPAGGIAMPGGLTRSKVPCGSDLQATTVRTTMMTSSMDNDPATITDHCQTDNHGLLKAALVGDSVEQLGSSDRHALMQSVSVTLKRP